jgi:hypothetical protein
MLQQLLTHSIVAVRPSSVKHFDVRLFAIFFCYFGQYFWTIFDGVMSRYRFATKTLLAIYIHELATSIHGFLGCGQPGN